MLQKQIKPSISQANLRRLCFAHILCFFVNSITKHRPRVDIDFLLAHTATEGITGLFIYLCICFLKQQKTDVV